MLVLYNCGRWWGKNFYTRFCEELTDYHNRSVSSLSMAEFMQALQDSCSSIGRYSSDSKCGSENRNVPIENVISEPPITFALHFRLKYSLTR